MTIFHKKNVCPNRPNRTTLNGGIGSLRHRDTQYVNPSNAAGEGLAAAALPHHRCCLTQAEGRRDHPFSTPVSYVS